METMENETEYFLSQDGSRLYYRHWPVKQPKQILCIVHGLAEHSARYTHVAQYLNEHQTAVFAMDLRGHGLSEGKRGHAKNFALLLSDVEELLKTARAEYTDTPMYLMGHSMGGGIVANYVWKMNTNELEGFILSSPWIRLALDPPKWKANLAKKVSSILPSLTQQADLDTSHLSRDAEVVKAYENDPLVHGVISARLFTECMKYGEAVLKNAGEINLKGLVFHGTEDKITSTEASQLFADTNEKIEFKPIVGSYHETLNDLNQSDVLKLIKNWLKR